mmetsp:Transcript_11385/g.51540  ORF Transcript_11385/g.51540 Transcript_11385/m.51540 type:complete len:238 (-) Transcript_11385:1921-2634(-)
MRTLLLPRPPSCPSLSSPSWSASSSRGDRPSIATPPPERTRRLRRRRLPGCWTGRETRCSSRCRKSSARLRPRCGTPTRASPPWRRRTAPNAPNARLGRFAPNARRAARVTWSASSTRRARNSWRCTTRPRPRLRRLPPRTRPNRQQARRIPRGSPRCNARWSRWIDTPASLAPSSSAWRPTPSPWGARFDDWRPARPGLEQKSRRRWMLRSPERPTKTPIADWAIWTRDSWRWTPR